MKKKPFFFSLRYKLQCIILLLVALPLVVVAGTAYMLNARSLSERDVYKRQLCSGSILSMAMNNEKTAASWLR